LAYSYNPLPKQEEERFMANKDEPHEIENIIARRNKADAKRATAAADAHRETQQLRATVKEAFAAAQESLRAEIKKANEAIKRSGRTEEFRFQPNPQPGSGNLLAANLTLSDSSGLLQDYAITVDANDGRIAVRGSGVTLPTLQQILTNVLQVKGDDWARFLSGMYEANMR
jgi:ATPase subunit of ABC transporter with duplicated ATPase domains